jgi:hypothetical protein
MRIAPLVILLAACSPAEDIIPSIWDQPAYEQDSDDDGLTDEFELSIGSDLNNPDTDGDGLDDGEEIELGADPLVTDTDGDGFDDGEEVDDGTNPTYAPSHTYSGDYKVGYCASPPNDADAGPTGNGAYGVAFQEGDLVGNLQMLDGFGEIVELHSFCGRNIMLAIGALWCSPCHDMAKKGPAHLAENPDLTIIEIMTQDYNYDNPGTPTEGQLTGFSSQYGLNGIPVVKPAAGTTWESKFEYDGYIPTVVMIGPDLRVIAVDPDIGNPSTFDPSAYFE